MQVSREKKPKERPENISERIYAQLKEDIATFRLLPGERFTEGEIADRVQASRTPVRHALFRLEQEGYVQVYFRSGWQVCPFDLDHFEELYDVRALIELAALDRLNVMDFEQYPLIRELSDTWLVPEQERIRDTDILSRLCERFHCALVEAAGNREMARMHWEITEKVRIIRRFDFTDSQVDHTYEEHGQILQAVLHQEPDLARRLLKTHIKFNKQEAHRLTERILCDMAGYPGADRRPKRNNRFGPFIGA